MTQISIVFLYRRIFTLLIGWFRVTFYCLLILSASSGIAISLAAFLRCMPISYNWDPTIRGAHCGVNMRDLAVTTCVINLLLDLCIVAAPMPLVWKLHANFATKAALTGMFLLAGLSVLPERKGRTRMTDSSAWLVFASAIWSSLCIRSRPGQQTSHVSNPFFTV